MPHSQLPAADSMETHEQRRQRHEREQKDCLSKIEVQEKLRWIDRFRTCGHHTPRPIYIDVVADLRRPGEESKAREVPKSRIEGGAEGVAISQGQPQPQQHGHQQPSTQEEQPQQRYHQTGTANSEEQQQDSAEAAEEQLDKIAAG